MCGASKGVKNDGCSQALPLEHESTGRPPDLPSWGYESGPSTAGSWEFGSVWPKDEDSGAWWGPGGGRVMDSGTRGQRDISWV